MLSIEIIEFKNKRVLTTKQLADGYKASDKNIIDNFNNHKDRFIEGKHYYKLEGTELKDFKRVIDNIGDPSIKFASVLILWTDKGALRHAKILDTDKAWDVYEMLEETYFKSKEQQLLPTDLSPELQYLIQLERRQNKTEQELISTKQEIQDMRDVITLDTTNWRTESVNLIVKIAETLGGNEYIKEVHKEIYKLLDIRMGVKISTRLSNKRARMSLEGICKSKINKTNQLDIIAEDKKLIEGYVAIIKEMCIKYGIGLNT